MVDLEEDKSDEVTIEVYKGKEIDEGATRAIDKITENRELKICIPKEVIEKLAKELTEGKAQPSQEVYIRCEYNVDTEDENNNLSTGVVIAC